MTAVLPPTISNPFNTTPGPNTCRLDGPFSFPEHAHDLDTISLNTATQERSRQVSPASIFSVASAPPIRNNENVSPLARFRNGPGQLRSISSQNPKSPCHDLCDGHSRPRNFAFQPLCKTMREMLERDEEENGILSHQDTRSTTEGESDIANMEPDLMNNALKPPFTPAPSQGHNKASTETTTFKHTALSFKQNAMVTPETGILTRIRELRHQSASRDHDIASLSPTPSGCHQHGFSDGSSGFVHSMKTASETNLSFSVVPRSSRMGRSTDSYMLHSSQPRHSIDSDRPLSSNSVDDIALRRGFKRHQIIDELIATEESYVADLKALVYLYSTLLASTSSIPSRVRVAIEQNVSEILHSHEKIVGELHHAKYQAAARRWAATVVPTKLGHQRRSHLRLSERESYGRICRTHRQTRSSVEASDILGQHILHSGSAEPVDVHEIALIFKNAVKSFYAYEEYCANFEMIGHELQKHMPQLWSTYESGMESLSRVILAIDQRQFNDRKGLTVGDLLIKPIQRLTKYPLLLEQLLHSTPVADAPGTHAELDFVLQSVRDVVHMVNLARDNQYARLQIQRRWLLQDRLDLLRLNISPEQFRSLGSIELCGILHVAYQTTVAVDGGYALCALLDEHFLIAFPVVGTGRFQAIALVQLSDIKIEAATDGKGYYHELILSGCSKIEEDHWVAGLRGEFSSPVHQPLDADTSVATCIAFDLKSVGVVFSSQKSLSRESSVQRAATVGGRPSISQVIVRNTHNAHDLHEYRDSTASISSINRSQSHLNTKRIPVLEPKRSERTRLENTISDIWTKERLPFPGMVGSRGGQIIRASAGSLARKLSLASIHTPFTKGRTSSLSMASRKSYDLFNDAKSTFEIRRRDLDLMQPSRHKPKDIPEVDDMRSVVGRMIGNGVPTQKRDGSSGELVVDRKRSASTSKRALKSSFRGVGPDDPAAIFYQDPINGRSKAGDLATRSTDLETHSIIGIDGPRRRKRRWSKPISRLKELGSEARSIFNSSSSAA